MEQERLRAIVAAADSLQAACEVAGAEGFTDIEAIAVLWAARSVPLVQVVAPPPPERMTTFEEPRMVDPYINRIHNEVTQHASYTSLDATEIFCRWHADHIRKCRQTGLWYTWNARLWEECCDGDHILNAIRNFCGVYGQAALLEFGGKAGAALQRSISSAGFMQSIFGALQSHKRILCDVEDLDRDAWLLNTPEAIFDLRTGERIRHDPRFMCTKITSVAPSSAQFQGTRFSKFLQEIFANVSDDSERERLIEFEQQSLGYCCTGDSKLHFIKFWHGEGRNGKSTLGEAVQNVLGNYTKKINNQMLMLSRSEHHPTEVANLLGARLVVASEITEGAYLNEAMVKELTGDSRLSARFMRRDFFEFRRTHKHLIYGNHKPRLRVTDPAIRARLKLTEFGVNFEDRIDPMLSERLGEESGVILGWLMDGAQTLYENRLRLPRSAVVEAGTDEYMAENDLVKLWIEERCVVVGSARTKTMTAYEDYRAWRSARGEHPEAIQRWGQIMKQHGFDTRSVNGYRHLIGVGLRTDRDEF